MKQNHRKIVGAWLLLGVFLVFFQIIIGGITRLTGSGLSITEWEIVIGSVPPTSTEKWESEFEKYQATPQYEKINQGMSLDEFKFIYFWEWLHRFWARWMGVIFIIPFLFFLFKRWLTRPWIYKLIMVMLLASLVASFGWIMVASGLIDRPWVDAYKLTLHLCLALVVFAYLVWLSADMLRDNQAFFKTEPKGANWLKAFGILLIVQIILGGMMSGMHAALSYPTWPDMRGAFMPSVVLPGNWNVDAFTHYDTDPNLVAQSVIQFFHRMTAYILTIVGFVLFFKFRPALSDQKLKLAVYALPVMILIQVILGILTLINSIGSIPVGLGVYHQGGAIILLALTTFIYFHFKRNVSIQ